VLSRRLKLGLLQGRPDKVLSGGFIYMQAGRAMVRALVCAGLAMGMAASGIADPLLVKTEQGKVRGKAINDGKVKAFLGLPYAAPPVGELRWKAPERPAKWQGERDGTTFGPRCGQNPDFDDMVFQDAAGPKEDCLYLNVYAPTDATAKSKLPVMYWIHGGGYTGGSADEPRHNGDFLPLKGVVLVTINYRLGVFGFLATSELAKEAGGTAGNYGLMDMIAGLNWVKKNIGKFGGDEKNVTIFGESAGSFAVSTLMASPMAKGLFTKAIGESGGAFSGTLPMDSLETREKKDDEWVAGLGVKSLAELRALPMETLLADVKENRHGFSTTVDGKVLTEPVPETYAEGKQAKVPLIAGWNRDEGSFLGNGMTAEKWKAMAATLFPDRTAEFLKVYPGSTDDEAVDNAGAYGGDSFIAFGTWKWLEADRKTSDAPVYRYHFELRATPSKFHEGTFAFHSDDIEYVFGTLDTRPGFQVRPEDRKLSDEMMSYWTNFARTGDPNGPGLPTWPKYGKDDEVLHLDTTVTAAPDTLRPRYEFLLKGMPPPHD
jgi:para-nitrobenzyl esterase